MPTIKITVDGEEYAAIRQPKPWRIVLIDKDGRATEKHDVPHLGLFVKTDDARYSVIGVDEDARLAVAQWDHDLR